MKNAYIFGAGTFGKNVIEKYNNMYNILGFIDNDSNKWGSELCGLTIISPSDIPADVDLIIIASMYLYEISMQLNEMGIPSNKVIFAPFRDLECYTSKTPSSLSLSIGSDKCLNECLFCTQCITKPHSVWLDPQLLKKVVAEMPNEEVGVSLCSFSETLLAPNLLDCVRSIKEAKPKAIIHIDITGIIYNEELFIALFDHLDGIKISLNVMSAEEYAALMGTDNFDRIIRNIYRLQNLIDEKKADTVIVVQIMNFKNITCDQFKSFAAPLTSKGIYVSACDVVNLGGNDDVGKVLTSKLIDSGFIPMINTDKERYPCLSLFGSIYLNEYGHYYPCCCSYFPGFNQRFDKFKIGDAREMSFLEAWEIMDDYRKMHLDGNFNCMNCVSCDTWASYANVF